MKKIGALFIIAVLLSISCGGKEKVKPSADSILTQNALSVVDTIKAVYQKKDRATLQENLSLELSEIIAKELFFEKAELSFTPRIIKIKDSTITVILNWRGIWKVEGKILKNRGVGVLIFQKETLKLIQIDSDNPFLTPIVK